jgi:hypothetical protein
MNKALTIVLRANDLFNQQNYTRSFISPQYRTEQYSQWASQFFSLNISYTFGTTPRMEEHDMPRGGGPQE